MKYFRNCLIPYFAASLCVEAGYLIFPGRVLLWTGLKAIVFIILAFRLKYTASQIQGASSMLGVSALGLYATADLVISWNLIAGGILYAIGHLCLLSAMSRLHRISRSGLIFWLDVSIAVSIVLLIVFRSSILFGAGVAFYGVILLAVPICAYSFSLYLRYGTLTFFFSDFSLVVYLLFPGLRVFQIVGILLFYLSMLLISESVRIGEI